MVGLESSGTKLSPIREDNQSAPACLGKYLSSILAGCGSTTAVEGKQRPQVFLPLTPLPKGGMETRKEKYGGLLVYHSCGSPVNNSCSCSLRGVPPMMVPTGIFNSSTSVNSIQIVCG
ncbi:uncharacterized protein AFUA_5G12970 [Aspergillus fumigatus Af293]|uniref:Uncharacterized protein n=1 Tax=Aspergillus fumigatus (strain ATCC MYA-4609 / CBS 101355 / FGSC A1100 / Af293) TaxID=330879 RepID=Q4WVQ8_ASPFU|nr:hypothetical protein AFUA_5G12970 [Aspergillus fumigatus Af293]EAL91318.1 hypothetical protein AFUA_5G12970 [Aspergillus fumigatus Af293]